jgi:hypothetical protein
VIREEAVLFGTATPLSGVVSEPEQAPASPSRPAVILLNAGLLHRVGPSRVYVTLARRLAAEGFVVLRFDFSNIGDSPPRVDGLPFERSTIEETRDAMAFLEASRGPGRFLVLGSCAGADHALRIACVEPRVIALGLIDLCAWPDDWYRFFVYARRAWQPQAWWSLLSGHSQLWARLGAAGRHEAEGRPRDRGAGARRRPSLAAVADSLVSLGRRDVAICLWYSWAGPGHFNYRRGLARAVRSLRRSGRIHVQAFPEADHLFTASVARQALAKSVVEFVLTLPPAPTIPSGGRAGAASTLPPA